MKNEIVIKIEGGWMSGKSRVLCLLKQLLKDKGFEIEFDGGLDFENESQFNDQMEQNLESVLNNMTQNTFIKFEEIQIPNKSIR